MKGDVIVMGALGGIVLIVALLLLSAFLGDSNGREIIRTEAVERGYAEWVPDKHGNTTFKWKEVAK